MKKVKVIKELEPDIKVVRELKGKKEDIQLKTSGEVPFTQDEISRATSPVLESNVGGERIVTPSSPPVQSVRPRQSNLDEPSGNKLYDAGSSMGGVTNRKYANSETVGNTSTMRERSVGSEFALPASSAGAGTFASAQHVEHKLRTDMDSQTRDDYQTGGSPTSAKSSRRKYPWEL